MFEQSELRSRREERRRDGVKNLNGSETIYEYFLIITHTKWKRTYELSPCRFKCPAPLFPFFVLYLWAY